MFYKIVHCLNTEPLTYVGINLIKSVRIFLFILNTRVFINLANFYKNIFKYLCLDKCTSQIVLCVSIFTFFDVFVYDDNTN